MLTSNLLHDLRYTLRQLRRSPGFAATSIVTLGLGIGATTAMYSIVRSTLLAPLPYPHPDELVGVGFSHPGEAANNEQTGQTADFLLDHAASFLSAGVADDGSLGQNLSVTNANAGSSSETIRSLRVSSGYLPAFAVSPQLGRTFTRADDTPGAAPTAVLSDNLWRRAFNADPNILGRVLHLNGDPYTVIGVMPPTFRTVETPDLWQPLHLAATDPGYEGDNYQFIARLKPGVSAAQAAAELTSITPAIYRQFPGYRKWGPAGAPVLQEFVWPLQQIVASAARPSLLALSAAVLAVLLMACLNLAGLITARSAAKRSEIALRSALGAGRIAMLRLLLTESLVLALAGSMLGLAIARIGIPVLLAYSPIDLPPLHLPGVDLGLAVFAIAVCCGTTFVFGLLPALGVFRQTLSSQISGGRTAGESAPQQRLGRSLLVAQVALATTLLSVGAVLLGTFLRLRSIPPGVRPEHLYALQVNLKGETYSRSLRTQQFVSAVEDRLRGIPGVKEVAAVNGLPLDRGLNDGGYPLGRKELQRSIESRFITPGYLRTAGTPLLAGTDLSMADTATSPHVVLINQRAADLWWPGRSAIGESIVEGGSPSRIIGIVANAHNRSLADDIRPTVYHPFAQVSDQAMKTINGWFSTTFVLRVKDRNPDLGNTADPDIASAAAAALASVEPEVPVSKFAPMQSFIDHTVATPRFFSWLAGGFAAFALLLTLIGLFGLLSYQVASRTREIGIRMALGAQRSQILTFILGNGLVLTALGLCVGIAGSFALRRLLASFLAGATRVDPQALSPILASQITSVAMAAAAMLLSAAAASLIPASRAASVEPTEALRTE